MVVFLCKKTDAKTLTDALKDVLVRCMIPLDNSPWRSFVLSANPEPAWKYFIKQFQELSSQVSNLENGHMLYILEFVPNKV